MAEPDNIVLVYLRRIDEKLDRVIGDVRDLNARAAALLERLIGIQRRMDRVGSRIDRVEERLGRIEMRLDPVDLPH